jgi:Cellulase (glycosyl hydrolase family 5)
MWKSVPRSVRGFANRAVIGMTTVALVAATGSHFVMPEVNHVATYEVANVAAVDDSPTSVGIADSNIYFTDSIDEVIERLELAESLGVKNIRLLVPWWHIQTQDPLNAPVDWDADLNWAKLDQIVQEADARGLGILGVLQWTPAWATDGIPGMGIPSDVQDFADFAAAVATRYDEEITSFEVWNEPNAAFFWNPVDPIKYTEMLKATYTSLKAVNEDITVVGAVVGAGITIGQWTMNPVDFVTAMYASGADGYFDALSFHPYNFYTKFSEQDPLGLTPLFQVLELRELMDSHLQPGEEQLKIWITEYGLPTSQVSAAVQLDFMRDMLTAWQSFSGGGPVFLYSIKDDPDTLGDERFFGIFDEFGNVKDEEALAQLKELIKCLDGCSPTNPTNPLATLMQFVQQFVTQVLTFVPTLIAALSAAVSNWLGTILGAATTPGLVGASLRTATTDEDALSAAAEVGAEGSPAADGVVEEGAVAEELAVTDEVPVEEAVVEEAVVAEVAPEEVIDEEIVAEEVVAEEVVAEEVPAPEVVAEEVVEDDVVAGEVVTDEVVTDEVVTDEVVTDDEVTEDETVTEEPAADEVTDTDGPETAEPTASSDPAGPSEATAKPDRVSAPKHGDESASKSADTGDESNGQKLARGRGITQKAGSTGADTSRSAAADGPRTTPSERETRSAKAESPASAGADE